MGCQFSGRAKHTYIIEIFHDMKISKPPPPPYQSRDVSVLCTSACPALRITPGAE